MADVDLTDEFLEQLYLMKFESEQEKAEKSLSLLDSIITETNSSSARGFLNIVCNVGAIIQARMPWETTPLNMCKKVEKVIKDEYNSLLRSLGKNVPTQNIPQSKIENFLETCEGDNWDQEVESETLKNNILEVLLEQKSEIEQCQELISSQGESKIHNDEIIMTCGYSPNVLSFFLRAAKTRKFHVIIAEGAPQYSAAKMAKPLCLSKVQTTVIPDSAVFAFMSRVNKVIIGCRTVSRNGGITTFVGATAMAAAAKHYSVPVYVCAPTYQFSPEMAENIKVFDAPPYCLIKSLSDNVFKNVNASVSRFDYVPPENVTSFITNNRGIVPSYIYRQVLEIYQPSAEDTPTN